jgi:RHS repeat-associated protein
LNTFLRPATTHTTNSLHAFSRYRFHFNGKEEDSEAQTQDYGFRIYNPRLGKFLSVDPLFKSYTWNSTYAFSENRPIDGIDLDGLEYLNANTARIEAKFGRVQLKIENFSSPMQSAYQQANLSSNWTPGQIGASKTVVNLQFKTDQMMQTPTNLPLPTPPKVPDDAAPALNNADDVPTPGPGATRIAAGAVAVVNAINWATNIYASSAKLEDVLGVKADIKAIAPAIADINTALSLGEKYIPYEYQNPEALTNILNVVLQGVNNSNDENIYSIGIKIVQEISKNYKLPVQPATSYGGTTGGITPADNTTTVTPIITPVTLPGQ